MILKVKHILFAPRIYYVPAPGGIWHMLLGSHEMGLDSPKLIHVSVQACGY